MKLPTKFDAQGLEQELVEAIRKSSRRLTSAVEVWPHAAVVAVDNDRNSIDFYLCLVGWIRTECWFL